ncbi:MAG: hypothetical protein JXR10_00150 [Cyclobacteriaceae bacterium]
MKTEKVILIAGILLFSATAFAQGAPPATPIDGGLSILLAAGGAYGLKKLRDSKKK